MREIDNQTKFRFAGHLFIGLLALAALKMAAPVRDAEGFSNQNTQSVLVAPEIYSPRTEEGYLIKPPVPVTIFTPPLGATKTSKLSSKPTDNIWGRIEKLYNGEHKYTVEDSLEAIKSATPQVACTIFQEAGRDTEYSKAYDPYTLDGPDLRRAYNIGIGQFAKEKGKLPEFFSLGYTDPFNPYEVVPYMNGAFAGDQQWAWGPTRLRLC